MHTRLLIPVVLLAASVLGACAPVTAGPEATADIRLSEVRRPEDVRDRWGEYEIREAEEEGYVYEDSLVRVTAVPTDPSFNMVIENKTNHSLQLIWDRMSFVGPNGVASPVTSGETRVMNVGESQTPTPIPAHSKVGIVAIPNSQISQDGYGADVNPIYPVSDSLEFEEAKGDSLRLIVPLQVEDTVNEFTFVFSVRDIWLEGRRGEARQSDGSREP